MRKRILISLVVIVMAVMSVVSLTGCMPFSVDNYIAKLAKLDNFTLVYEWEANTGDTKDYYYFTKDKFGVSTAFEYVADLKVRDEIIMYLKNNNVWTKSKPITRTRFMEYMGFDEDGGFSDSHIHKDNYKNKMMGFLETGLKLASSSIEEKFNVVDGKYVLRADCVLEVFGSDATTYGDYTVWLENGSLHLNMVWNAVSLKFYVENVGNTKIKITNEMKNSKESYNIG